MGESLNMPQIGEPLGMPQPLENNRNGDTESLRESYEAVQGQIDYLNKRATEAGRKQFEKIKASAGSGIDGGNNNIIPPDSYKSEEFKSLGASLANLDKPNFSETNKDLAPDPDSDTFKNKQY